MLQHLLVQALADDGRFATVVAAPSRVPSEYLLEIELRQFEAVSDGHAGAGRARRDAGDTAWTPSAARDSRASPATADRAARAPIDAAT